jgi:hypothetical protein
MSVEFEELAKLRDNPSDEQASRYLLLCSIVLWCGGYLPQLLAVNVMPWGVENIVGSTTLEIGTHLKGQCGLEFLKGGLRVYGQVLAPHIPIDSVSILSWRGATEHSSTRPCFSTHHLLIVFECMYTDCK